MSYEEAKRRYAAIGVDAGAAIEKLKKVPVSLGQGPVCAPEIAGCTLRRMRKF